jgi:hypothetical protein
VDYLGNIPECRPSKHDYRKSVIQTSIEKIALKKLLVAVLVLMPLQVILFGLLQASSIAGWSIVLFCYGVTVGYPFHCVCYFVHVTFRYFD